LEDTYPDVVICGCCDPAGIVGTLAFLEFLYLIFLPIFVFAFLRDEMTKEDKLAKVEAKLNYT